MSARYIPKVTFPEEVLDKIFKCKGLGSLYVEYDGAHDHLGLLLNTDVDRWRIQRKIFVQSLTPSFIEHIGRVAHTEGPLLVSAIKSMRDKNGVCDIHDLVQNLFARTIVPLALGFDRATTEGAFRMISSVLTPRQRFYQFRTCLSTSATLRGGSGRLCCEERRINTGSSSTATSPSSRRSS